MPRMRPKQIAQEGATDNQVLTWNNSSGVWEPADSTRQTVYDNQGTTVVDLLTNATMEVGTGLTWVIRDEADKTLVSVGTAATTTIQSSDGVAATNPGSNISVIAGTGNTSGSGGTITVTAGVGGATDGAGGDLFVAGGAGGATNGDGGNVQINAGAGTGSGVDGDVTIGQSNTLQTFVAATNEVDITTALIDMNVSQTATLTTSTADTSAVLQLETTGTGGDAVSLFTGNSSPNTRVTGSIGSLFIDGTNATLWQNTNGSTGWQQFSTGSIEDRQDVYDNQGATPVDLTGNATLEVGTGLTWIIRDEADKTLVSLGTASTTTIQSSDGVAATNPGSNISVIAGVGNTSGAGGDITVTAGVGGGTDGAGGDLFVAGGAGGATNGDGGNVQINAGAASGSGVDGDVTIGQSNTLQTFVAATNEVDITTALIDMNVSQTATLTSSTADTSAVLQLETTGTGADAVGLFTGASSPDGRVTGAIGSLFMDGTNATLWVNQDGATDWDRALTVGSPRQELVTTQTVTGTDTALTDTLNATPLSDASVVLYLNGVQQTQGAGEDYTISGNTITWLALTGTAVDMDTSDELVAVYNA